VLAHYHWPLLRSIVMAGGSTVVAYFRSQWPLDYQFATHTWDNQVLRDNIRQAFRNYSLFDDIRLRSRDLAAASGT
jgi:hypothetical protein